MSPDGWLGVRWGGCLGLGLGSGLGLGLEVDVRPRSLRRQGHRGGQKRLLPAGKWKGKHLRNSFQAYKPQV